MTEKGIKLITEFIDILEKGNCSGPPLSKGEIWIS